MAVELRHLFLIVFLGTESALAMQAEGNKRFVLEVDLETEVRNLMQGMANMTAKMKDMENEITQLKTENTRLQDGRGAVFVRWGRNVCPTTSDIIYKGYSAGKNYQNKGAGSNYLCLPNDPTWSNYANGRNTLRGYVFGIELETHDSEHIFNDAVYNEDIPCAVCQSKRSATMMIPGRNSCYGNWTTEYHGYLMSAYYDHYSTSYICVDERPDFIPGGAGNADDSLLYFVESICGSLQCPPYVDGRELTCAVCSK